MLQKALSMLQKDEMDLWQRPFWSDIRGASLRDGHPAPFPVELVERLIRMYSFAGDVVLDPFSGSGSTAVAACRSGRNSLSSDVEQTYVEAAVNRVRKELSANIEHGAHLRQLVYENPEHVGSQGASP
jgi:site-specific DNA-methyltransferase (adenine-specific)